MDSVVIHGSLGQRVFLFGYQGRTDTSDRILGAIYTVLRPKRHNSGVSLPLIISGHGFCGHPWLSRSEGGPFSLSCQGRTYTSTRILGAIYTVPRPIRHNPHVSLPLIISGHGFCGHPWLSRSEGGPFSLAAREGLTLVLGFWELYIYCTKANKA